MKLHDLRLEVMATIGKSMDDLLDKYLFLCGRVDMREMEVTTQHLINDGFDIGTGRHHYNNFIYTSFQELATNISHRRVATLVKKTGNTLLAKINGIIAADEARHASAYSDFVKRIFELDPSQMMTSFEEMMRRKIVMPAHFMRQSGDKVGELWSHFSDAAQRTKVYTAQDYITILSSLIKDWNIDKITDLNEFGEKARDYLMALPGRLQRITDRMQEPEKEFQFKWIGPTI